MYVITGSPLWRNGPSSKPVLCNACGSRWRTKGTLANYIPLHSKLLRATGSVENSLPLFHESTAWHVKRHIENSLGHRCSYAPSDQCTTVSRGSSSGSGALVSESSAQLGSEANAMSGLPLVF